MQKLKAWLKEEHPQKNWVWLMNEIFIFIGAVVLWSSVW